jgi:hypothetical protein
MIIEIRNWPDRIRLKGTADLSTTLLALYQGKKHFQEKFFVLIQSEQRSGGTCCCF